MRKITTLKVFSIIMIVGLVFSCASTSNNSPEWILSPTSVYSDEEYLSAVGYGADRASAENAAIAAITKTIKQAYLHGGFFGVQRRREPQRGFGF